MQATICALVRFATLATVARLHRVALFTSDHDNSLVSMVAMSLLRAVSSERREG